MHCSNCGAKLDDDAAFCGACGTPVQESDSSASQDDAWQTSVIADSDAFEGMRLKSSTPQFSPTSDPSSSSPGHTSAVNPDAIPLRGQATAYGQDASYGSSAPHAYATAPAVQSSTATMPVQPAYDEQPKASPTKIVAITIIVCAFIVLAAVGGMFAIKQVQTNENRHAMTEVQFAFSYSGEAANEPVGVPLLVKGTDLDGNHAVQQILATSTGGTLEFLAGSYTISVDGYPASTSGVVYQVQGENARTLEIPEPSEDGSPTQVVVPDMNYSFTTIAADKVTDRDIEDIEKWMTTYGVEPNEIKQVVAAVTERRNAEVTRLSLEREKQAALDSNPSSVPGTNINHDAPAAQLTGTVCVEYFNADSSVGGGGNVCYLQLPKIVYLSGTQYGDMNSNRVILPDSMSSYKGQVITMSAHYSGRATASIKEAGCSPIWAYDVKVVRTF